MLPFASFFFRERLRVFIFGLLHSALHPFPPPSMATPVPLGGMATFNMLHGFPEAIVRGYRSGFLGDSDYHHLTQCETLEVITSYFFLFISF